MPTFNNGWRVNEPDEINWLFRLQKGSKFEYGGKRVTLLFSETVERKNKQGCFLFKAVYEMFAGEKIKNKQGENKLFSNENFAVIQMCECKL